ncbi:MAG TPA: DUF4260 domain-containing protein [Terriglobales bacterium]|nr:DUF4260 domain-containing protein [Terriglobales bacterium]
MLLLMEGATIFVASLLLYRHYQAGWALFAILFFTPDILMIGYAFNARAGAALYNSVHTLVSPGVLLAISFLAGKPNLLSLALIWTAHIGLDRAIGYGLKYPTHFKGTHLQHV